MTRAFLSFSIFAALSILFATPIQADSLQERFDNLAKLHSFGETEVSELQAIIAEEKESGEKVDCTFCPDAFTWYLAEQDLFDETTWLFDHNADYGIRRNDDGMTLLHAVCLDGHKDFAEMLIKRGAEINLPDHEGRAAIHYAVMGGNSALVESILQLGCDPNKLTKKKETPLHFAAKYSGLEEVKFLVEHGASIKAINWTLLENLKEQRIRQDKLEFDSNEERIIALKKALGLKTPEALQDEEEEEDEDEDEDEDKDSESKSKDEQIIVDIDKIPVELFPRDTNDAANTDGMTALHFAAQNGDTAIVQYLVEHGAEINAQDEILSRTAIHLAAEKGNLDCIKYLAEHGANLQDKDSFGATAFHYAVKSNKLDVVKYLVSRKMDYNAKDVRGWTAMHYAAYGDSIDVVKYLLAKGLNINEKNKSGRTPLFFAREHRELRKFMISQGAQ
jgi:ankyrin repeat protein